MTIKDAPNGRLPETAMRDLLRRLEREATANHPARPTVEPPPEALSGSRSVEQLSVDVGAWRLTHDPHSGDLMAIDPDGQTHTLIQGGRP